MNKKASMLNKMADLILKSADKAEALAKSKERANKIKALHEALTSKYRFNIVKGYDTKDVQSDIDFLKKAEVRLMLTELEERKLHSLFSKYGIS